MRVPDGAHARLHLVDAVVGGHRGEHVLPDRIARARVVEAERAANSSRAASSFSRYLGGLISFFVHTAAAAALARSRRCQPVDTTGRGCRSGTIDRSRAASSTHSSLGAVADQVAQAPDASTGLLASSSQDRLERRKVPVDVGDQAIRRVSVSVAMRRVGYSLPVAAVAAVVAATAAALLIRPRGGLIDPAAVDATAYFSPDSGASGGLSRPAAATGAGGVGLERHHAGAAACGCRASGCAGLGRSGARPPRARASRWCSCW